MAKILGKTHKPKVLGVETHSVSLMLTHSHIDRRLILTAFKI